ncbi:MAG: cobalt ECF transporter T component CbiQ [Syntrophorhabdales bacterium]|jgi:cobalt/nickel transport system permease protein
MHTPFPEEKRGHPLTKVDARIKLLCAAAVLSMVLTCRGAFFPLLVAFFCLSTCASLRVSARRLLARFSEPLFIVAVLIVIKFLFSGHEVIGSCRIFGIEIAGHRDGLIEGLVLGARIVGAVSMIALLGFATPFTEFLRGLAWLRVPKGLIDVAMFAYRYIFLLLDEATVIYSAQKNRLGYSSIRRGLGSFGVLAGALALKAFDSSQHSALAMIQRGYDGNMPSMGQERLKTGHLALSALFLFLMGIIWRM